MKTTVWLPAGPEIFAAAMKDTEKEPYKAKVMYKPEDDGSFSIIQYDEPKEGFKKFVIRTTLTKWEVAVLVSSLGDYLRMRAHADYQRKKKHS